MAEIRIERRSPLYTWAWIVGGVVLAMVIVWMIAIATQSPRLANPRQRYAEQAGRTGVSPLQAILSAPASWIDHPVSVTGVIAQVNRGHSFWLAEDGRKIMVVVEDPTPEVAGLSEGQRVVVSGTVQQALRAQAMPGVQDLDQLTWQVLKTQPAFIYAQAHNVRRDLGEPEG